MGRFDEDAAVIASLLLAGMLNFGGMSRSLSLDQAKVVLIWTDPCATCGGGWGSLSGGGSVTITPLNGSDATYPENGPFYRDLVYRCSCVPGLVVTGFATRQDAAKAMSERNMDVASVAALFEVKPIALKHREETVKTQETVEHVETKQVWEP